MTLEDPFFVVQDEVVKAVTKTKGLYERWCEIQAEPGIVSKEEVDWTTNELRNSLRSIEWDLEDLDETITIVENNPRKFKIDNAEIALRKTFIEKTKEEVKSMKEKMNFSKSKDKDKKVKQPLLNSSPARSGQYTRLENELESPNKRLIDETQQQQQVMIRGQDEQLDLIQDSMGTLKTMSRQIGREIDEQAVMLDEFSHELDNTESRLDTTMKKVAKVLHMSNDRRQWIAIAVLSSVMALVIILFFIL